MSYHTQRLGELTPRCLAPRNVGRLYPLRRVRTWRGHLLRYCPGCLGLMLRRLWEVRS